MHILLLTDRDWTHPQGGGTGTNLFGQVSRWLAWGHTITVIAGDYRGAMKVEQIAPGLTVHRMGSRMTVFQRAAWATFRGIGRDADVVLEVVNGIAFCSPLWWWLKAPTVALIHHVHQEHYVAEMGWKGKIAAFVAERAPLRLLYTRSPVLTISQAARDEIVDLGLPRENVHVAYMGVDAPDPRRAGANKADEPTLLFLGRLKQYKRIEVVLDVLAGIPDARLEIAGEGDHRPVLEQEIAERGLVDRVTLHGHVSEDEKFELFGRAWVNLTASSAEGWCLTVMESATVGTPSAALRVGGLNESIVDEQTGLLADTPDELAARVHDLVHDPVRRDELGAGAQARARGFTWDHTAEQNLAVMTRTAEEERPSLRASMRRSETAKAAGMALATLAGNAIAIVFTVVFARLLGVGEYGALGALLSTFTILAVAGSALQVAVARETALGHLGDAGSVGVTVRRWLGQLIAAGVALTAASVILREEIAALVAVPEHAWAAAAIVPTGILWMLLGVLRGALQGLHRYAPVGQSIVLEAGGRLVLGLVLVLAGAGVTGAYLGTPLAMVVTGMWNNFAKLALPVVALAVLAIGGDVDAPRVLAAAVGLGGLAVAVAVFAAAMRTDAAASRVARVAATAATPVLRVIGRPRDAPGLRLVARREARLHVPQSHRVGIRGRVPREHGHDRDAGMRSEEPPAAQHRVVEVRRDDDHAFDLALEGRTPLAHRLRVHQPGRSRGHGVNSMST